MIIQCICGRWQKPARRCASCGEYLPNKEPEMKLTSVILAGWALATVSLVACQQEEAHSAQVAPIPVYTHIEYVTVKPSPVIVKQTRPAASTRFRDDSCYT